MTTSQENSSDRLDRIETILESMAQQQQETKRIVESNARAIQAMADQREADRRNLEETKRIVESNSRTIQAMLDQRETDRLEHEEQMAVMSNAIQRLIKVEEGLVNMVANVDENQPTILRRLMAIENKVDSLIERSQ
jgi:hypothetical protein